MQEGKITSIDLQRCLIAEMELALRSKPAAVSVEDFLRDRRRDIVTRAQKRLRGEKL